MSRMSQGCPGMSGDVRGCPGCPGQDRTGQDRTGRDRTWDKYHSNIPSTILGLYFEIYFTNTSHITEGILSIWPCGTSKIRTLLMNSDKCIPAQSQCVEEASHAMILYTLNYPLDAYRISVPSFARSRYAAHFVFFPVPTYMSR